MHKYRLYGASDDLAELEGDSRDEWSYPDGRIELVGSVAGSPAFAVVFEYGVGNGCWAVYPVLLDEDVPLPSGVTFEYVVSRCEYSTCLQVVSPVPVLFRDETGKLGLSV